MVRPLPEMVRRPQAALARLSRKLGDSVQRAQIEARRSRGTRAKPDRTIQGSGQASCNSGHKPGGYCRRESCGPGAPRSSARASGLQPGSAPRETRSRRRSQEPGRRPKTMPDQIGEIERGSKVPSHERTIWRQARLQRPIPGIGPVMGSLIAEMPDFGRMTADEAAAMTSRALPPARQATDWGGERCEMFCSRQHPPQAAIRH